MFVGIIKKLLKKLFNFSYLKKIRIRTWIAIALTLILFLYFIIDYYNNVEGKAFSQNRLDYKIFIEEEK